MTGRARRRRVRHSKTRWFWIALVLATVKKVDRHRPSARAEVWINHYLFSGRNESEAIRKAERSGRRQAGDVKGSLRLYGEPATTEFLGVLRVTEVDDDIVDGCEIGWDLYRRAIGPLRRRMRRARFARGV